MTNLSRIHASLSLVFPFVVSQEDWLVTEPILPIRRQSWGYYFPDDAELRGTVSSLPDETGDTE